MAHLVLRVCRICICRVNYHRPKTELGTYKLVILVIILCPVQCKSYVHSLGIVLD